MKHKKIYNILLFLILSFCGCATVYNPATQRNEFIFIDTEEEVVLGKQFSKQAESELEVSYDADLVKRVTSIGEKIALVSDRKDLEYHFKVIEDKEVNAFALPGGFVYVNTGLLKIITDDELACVLGHEVGHVAAKHSIKAIQAQLGYGLLMNIILSGQEGAAVLANSSNILFNVIHLKYSRDDEILSDKLGVKYAYLSGFDPKGALTFLEKLKKMEEEKDKGVLFLRSHPYAEQRIEAVKKEIDLIKQKQ